MKKILFAVFAVAFVALVVSKVQAYDCPSGYYWSGSSCVVSSSGTSGSTTCSSGQYWNGSSCVASTSGTSGSTTCPSGQYWSGSACVNTSTSDCPSGYYWSGSSCVVSTSGTSSSTTCPSGQYWSGSSCVTSTSGTSGSTTSYSSTCSTSLQTLLGTGCHYMYQDSSSRSIYCNSEMTQSAKEGDTAVTSGCTSGGSSTYTSGSGSTTCPSGQYWSGSACVASTSYTTSTTTTGSITTTCPSGYYWYTPSTGGTGYCQPSSTSSTYTQQAVPTELKATGSGAGSVTLSWTASSGATRYQIYRKLEGGSWNTVKTDLTAMTYVDTLPSGTHQYYVMACSNSGGCSPNAGLKVTVTDNSVTSTTFSDSSTSGTAYTSTYYQSTSNYAGDANSCPGFAYSRWDKTNKRYCQLNNEKKCDYNYPSYQTNGSNYKLDNCPAEEFYTYTTTASSACPSGVLSLLGSGCHQMYTDASGNPMYCNTEMNKSMKATDTVSSDGCTGSYYNASTYTYAGDANSCPGFAYSSWDKNGKRYCRLNAEKKCDYNYPSYQTNGANYKLENCPTDDSATTYTYVPPSSTCPSSPLSVLGSGCHQMYTDSDGQAIYCDNSMTRSMKASDTSAKSGCTQTYTGNANWTNYAWTFTDGSQSSFILNRTDKEYLDFVSGINAQCAKISKNKFGWKSGAGNDAATNWQSFGIPDCSGTVTAATCPSGQYWNGVSCVLTTITATCPSDYHYMSDYTGGSGGYCMSNDNSSTCQPLSGGATYTCGTKAIDTSTSQYKDWKKVDWGTGGSSYVPSSVSQDNIDATKAYITKNCPVATYYTYENSSDPNRPNAGVPSCPSTYVWNSTSTTNSSCPSGYHYMGGNYGGYSSYSSSYCMADSGSSTCQPIGGGATYTCPGYTVATTTVAIYPFTFPSSKKTCLAYQECFDYCKTTPGSGTGDPATCDSYFPGATAIVINQKDTIPPYIDYSKSFPRVGETNVPIGSKIHVEFNEPIDESAFKDTTFFILQEGQPTTLFGSLIKSSRNFFAQLIGASDAVLGKTVIQGTIVFSQNGFDFTPKESLKSKTTYTWQTLAGIKDKSGNKTIAGYNAVFTTAGGLFTKGIGKISGTVTDGKANSVEGAYVNIGDYSYTFWRSAQTNASGTYSFSDVPEGKYKISLTSPSSKTSLIGPADSTMTVEASKTTTKDLAFLISSKIIKGSVKSSGGTAITDAQISAYRQNGPGWTQTETNAQGEFAVTVSGGSWQVSAWPKDSSKASWTSDYSLNTSVAVSFADDSADETKTVAITVKSQNSTITGKVAYEDGRVPNSYDVSINITSAGRSYPISQLQSDGSFSTKVSAGAYDVSVWASDQSIKVAPKAITVLDNETKSVGTIKLTKASEKIVVKVVNSNEKAIANAWVSANQTVDNAYYATAGATGGYGGGGGYYGGYSGGYVSGKTDDSGLVTLSVSPGKWSVQASGDSSANYTNVEQPQAVTVEEKQTKTVVIKVGTIDASVTGFVKDETGAVVDDFYGYVYSESSSDTSKYNYGSNVGGSIDKGLFSFKVAAGTYKLKLNTSQNSLWTADKTVSVTVAKGETKSVDITVKKNNSSITGTIVNAKGAAITGISARVFATGDSGAWQESYVDSATGAYTIKVSPGTWFIGASIYDVGGKYTTGGNDIKVEVGSGKTVKQDIALVSSDATIKGTVKKIDGKPMAYVWVSVNSRSADATETLSAKGGYFSQGAQTDNDGAFSVTVPAGIYYVRTFAPSSSGIINPNEQKVEIASSETKTVALEFKKADITISGTAFIENAPGEAFIFAWSEKGGYIETRSGSDGIYTLKVGPNGTWRLGAKANYKNTYYKSAEVSIKTGDTGTINQDIALNSEKTLPIPVTKTVEADKPNVVSATDGTKITVPANSVSSAGQATVTVAPTTELPEQGTAKVIGTGYDVNAYDAVGKEVTKLNTELTITIPYDPEELKNLGVEAKDLQVAYYDETTATWMNLSANVVNEAEHTVTAVVSHLTRFALVAAADTIPPTTPTKVEAKALGSGKIKITWNNPEKDFKHAKVYRSEKEKELGAIRIAEVKGKEFTDEEGLKDGIVYYYTVRAVDPAGNESQNVEQTKIKANGNSPKASVTPKTQKTDTTTKSATNAKMLNKNLSFGAKGDDVKILQNILTKEGLFDASSTNGTFDKLTKEAVIKFQEKYASEILKPAGLTKGNGNVGTGTRAKLNQLIK